MDKKLIEARKKHAEFLKSVGYEPGKIDRDSLGYLEDSYLSIRKSPPVQMSNAVGNGFKRSVDDYKWKTTAAEKPETIREIEKKKTRLAPIANKTGYQYITDGADIETLGKKV